MKFTLFSDNKNRYSGENGLFFMGMDICFILRFITVLLPLMDFSRESDITYKNPIQLGLSTLVLGHLMTSLVYILDSSKWYFKLLYLIYPFGLLPYIQEIVHDLSRHSINGLLYLGTPAIGYWAIIITGFLPVLVILADTLHRPVKKQ